MKRIFTVLSVMLVSLALHAEGYQVNLLSARQMGMGHVGSALKLGSESMHFNPGALSLMDRNVDISAGVTGVISDIRYQKGNLKVSTDNPVSTPLYLYAGFKIYDNLAAGISLTTPYGSSLVWPSNWQGAHLIQEIDLKSFFIQPTLSYRITEKLSFGAGLVLAFGNVSLSRALMPVGSLAGVNPAYADVVPVAATLKGNSSLRLGYNLGAIFDISEKVTVGVSYRSKVKMRVKEGDAEINFASEPIRTIIGSISSIVIPPLDLGTFSAELPLPSNLNIGVAYRPDNRLLLSGELQFVGWKAYDELNLKFTQNVLNGYNIRAVKNYENTLIYRLGSQYAVTDRFDVRMGFYYDESPIQSDFYNPETPGQNKLGFSTGFSFRPYEHFSIDASFLYIHGIKRGGSYADPRPTAPENRFSGSYVSDVLVPSVGVSFSF